MGLTTLLLVVVGIELLLLLLVEVHGHRANLMNSGITEASTMPGWMACDRCFQIKQGEGNSFFVKRCSGLGIHCESVTMNSECVNSNVTTTNNNNNRSTINFDFTNCGLRRFRSKEEHKSVVMKLRSDKECFPGECPWLARVEIMIVEKLRAICAGAIIHPHWIITAAHCLVGSYIHHNISFVDPKNLMVSFATKPEGKPLTFATVEKYIVHPGFALIQEGCPLDDILLVKLQEPISFDRYVLPICLPRQGMKPPVGTFCTVAGWGKPEEKSTRPSTFIRRSDNTIISAEQCEIKCPGVADEKLSSFSNKLCVFNPEGHSICDGDSGTPLACDGYTTSSDKRYRWYVFGTASYGAAACDETNKQNIFAAVHNKIDWIKDVISRH